MARGADVNIRNKSGESPLDLAELRKHSDIVELLEKAVLEGPHGMFPTPHYPIQTVLSKPRPRDHLASTPGPLTFVSSWRAWFATTTWDRIEIELT